VADTTQPTTGCETCKYCTRQDYGYSNYTVEGSTLDCLKGLHPEMPIEDGYPEDRDFNRKLAFGETCASRVAGDGPYFDCDGEVTDEEACDNDPELLQLVKVWRAKS
jgi:hypothetical protein